ncbi:MAG TPA: CDP-alcohol phosphatidyltransferase family protein [Vicinamibacterales bacterium]|nr:CDP-alcohol phosphatidyltransferase family protein [Vicinamibacterales bacterium]
MRAILVHAYTASGAVLGYLSLRAAIAHDFRLAFAWMFAATIVDATDGFFARAANVATALPSVDGKRLDDIVDYLTFVIAPMLVLDMAGDVEGAWGLAAIAAVLLGSGYGFASVDAKTNDAYFTGFPSYWNIVALYLHLGRLGPTVNVIVLFVLTGLIFVRVGYVYPTRTPVLRSLTLGLAGAWAVLLAVLIWRMPAPSPGLLMVSLSYPVYYTILSFALQARRRAPVW